MNIEFMRQAIELAVQAQGIDEVPVGAVIVKDGKVIAQGYNLRENTQDATRHAEMIAIEMAANAIGSWRLEGCDIYVTLEPCPMCTGALIMARVDNLYFGAYDPKAGCCGSLYNLPEDQRFNHRVNVTGGIMQDECSKLLKDFFAHKRVNPGKPWTREQIEGRNSSG